MSDNRERMIEVLKDFKALMFITSDEKNDLSMSPMTVLDCEKDGTMWFAASVKSGKVRHVEETGEVYLSGQSGRSEFVAVHATASIEKSLSMKKEKFSEVLKVWFPKGAEDPDYALIKVEPTDGEYWDITGTNKLFYLADALSAYVMKRRPTIPEGTMHGKVN